MAAEERARTAPRARRSPTTPPRVGSAGTRRVTTGRRDLRHSFEGPPWCILRGCAALRRLRRRRRLGPSFPSPRSGGGGGGSSKVSRRRARRRALVWAESNAAIDALNHLYGCSGAPGDAPLTTEPSAAQASAQRRVAAAVSGSLPENLLSGPEALRELLGSKSDYEQSDSSVVGYEADKVSLPSGLRAPVPFLEVAGSEPRSELSLSHMLADDDVVSFREKYEPACLYLDANLRRSPSEYVRFLRRLFEVGILGFSREARGEVQPFFVRKKADRQRLVLDCRRVNQKFRRPPVPDMGSGECLHRLESPPGSPVSVGTADIRNCFYQCGIPPSWAEYFAFKQIPCDEAKEWGATCDVWGQSLPDHGQIYPVLQVLPMGWSWSFWIIQSLHVQFLAEAVSRRKGWSPTLGRRRRFRRSPPRFLIVTTSRFWGWIRRRLTRSSGVS